MEEALKKYYEHFGQNYPLCPALQMSDEEVIDDIEMCIESDTPAKEPDFGDEDY